MKKRGFTLVELVVVIAIFGVLAVVSTNFLVTIIQNSNQTTIQNEVRQNAARIMDDLASEIRNSGCLTFDNTNGKLDLYPESSCDLNDVGIVHYVVDLNTGALAKSRDGQSEGTITSSKVAVCSNSGCGASGVKCTPGIFVTPTPPDSSPTTRAVKIKLTVQQSIATTARADFCAQTSLENTVTPRNAFN